MPPTAYPHTPLIVNTARIGVYTLQLLHNYCTTGVLYTLSVGSILKNDKYVVLLMNGMSLALKP